MGCRIRRRTYGYKSEPIYDPKRKDAYGRPEIIGATRVIDAEAAEIVRKIFTWYSDGTSPRNIAARLNAEGVPSPGAQWRRKTRRTDAKWLASAIHGDPKRGSGILNNELYVGRLIWNRRQMKKRPRTSRRVAIMRTAEDQIVREEPTLRLIDEALWQRVKERQAKQAHQLGTRVIGGLRKHRPGGGRPSKYLLSGLLKCDACHAGFVLSNGARYQCASHINGGDSACSVSLSLLKDRAEEIILDFTERELPGILAAAEARYRQPDGPVDHSGEIRELEKQRDRLASAIKMGGALEVLVTELKATDVKITRLQAQAILPTTPAHIIAREPMERRLARMRSQLKQGGEIAQGVLRELFPPGFWLYPDPNGGRYLWAVTQTAPAADWQSHIEGDGHLPAEYWPRVYSAAADAASAVAAETVGNSMVAGARFEATKSHVVCFSLRRISQPMAILDICGSGHLLTPDNLRVDPAKRRWRCRRCGRARATEFRARQKPAA